MGVEYSLAIVKPVERFDFDKTSGWALIFPYNRYFKITDFFIDPLSFASAIEEAEIYKYCDHEMKTSDFVTLASRILEWAGNNDLIFYTDQDSDDYHSVKATEVRLRREVTND